MEHRRPGGKHGRVTAHRPPKFPNFSRNYSAFTRVHAPFYAGARFKITPDRGVALRPLFYLLISSIRPFGRTMRNTRAAMDTDIIRWLKGGGGGQGGGFFRRRCLRANVAAVTGGRAEERWLRGSHRRVFSRMSCAESWPRRRI